MQIFYLILIILYVWLLWIMERTWRDQYYPNAQEFKFHAAVLIPYRNEITNLPALLLNLQKVIGNSAEIFLIDDHSKDGSRELVESFMKANNHTHWRSLGSSGKGKKAALATAIPLTDAEIILSTDADCLLPQDWVSRMCLPFLQGHIQLVAGPVITSSGSGIFTRLQQVEWASILLLTRFLFSRGHPLLCSAANLAYRKSAFVEVGGFSGNENYPSGDDEFLLKKILGEFGGRAVHYLHGEEVLVKTHPLAGIGDFIQQRVRWGSKWKLHQSMFHKITALLTYLLAFFQIASIALLWGNWFSIAVFVGFWVIKIGFEHNKLGAVLSSFNIKLPLHPYVMASFLHPCYVLVVGLLANRGRYTWKGRKYGFST